MPFQGFTHDDFAVFQIESMEPRMDALIARVRPKLNELGNELAPVLSALCGEEMFPHVAKHARRTVHAPNDTWVAQARINAGTRLCRISIRYVLQPLVCCFCHYL